MYISSKPMPKKPNIYKGFRPEWYISTIYTIVQFWSEPIEMYIPSKPMPKKPLFAAHVYIDWTTVAVC